MDVHYAKQLETSSYNTGLALEAVRVRVHWVFFCQQETVLLTAFVTHLQQIYFHQI